MPSHDCAYTMKRLEDHPAETAPAFREQTVAHEMDRVLLERTAAMVRAR